jgi:polar amino acid transport system substrate-binding protein
MDTTFIRRLPLAAFTLAFAVTANLGGPIHAQGNSWKVQFSQPIFDMLPADIKQSKIVRLVGAPHAPEMIVDESGKVSGVQGDFGEALEQLLNIKVEHGITKSLPAALLGIEAGRYELQMSGISTNAEIAQKFDMIDWRQNAPGYMWVRGKAKPLTGVIDMCGTRVGTPKGGTMLRVTTQLAERCEKEGKPKLELLTFDDENLALLAMRAGRIDYEGNGAATNLYIAKQAEKDGAAPLDTYAARAEFGASYVGSPVSKSRPELRDAMLAAFQALFDSGDMKAMVAKWGVESTMLPAPGINLQLRCPAETPKPKGCVD